MSKNKNPEYLAEKQRRMKVRKQVRKNKRAENKRIGFWTKTWIGRDGRTMQNCSYQGICEFPCNGDC